jgi:hypothetical protein
MKRAAPLVPMTQDLIQHGSVSYFSYVGHLAKFASLANLGSALSGINQWPAPMIPHVPS